MSMWSLPINWIALALGLLGVARALYRTALTEVPFSRTTQRNLLVMPQRWLAHSVVLRLLLLCLKLWSLGRLPLYSPIMQQPRMLLLSLSLRRLQLWCLLEALLYFPQILF